MSLLLLLLIILILFGGFGWYGHYGGYPYRGPYYYGGLPVLIIVIILIWLFARPYF